MSMARSVRFGIYQPNLELPYRRVLKGTDCFMYVMREFPQQTLAIEALCPESVSVFTLIVAT